MLAATALAAALPSAGYGQAAKIIAGFAPERLGAPTAITFGFEIHTPRGEIPAPLVSLEFRYPTDLELAKSELGTATCNPAALEASGPQACPPDSVMGHGSAAVLVPFGAEVVPEQASTTVVAGPSNDGYIRLLLCAIGYSPVLARIVMPTVLMGGLLHVSVPLVPSLPEGPDVAVTKATVTLGGNLTYYEDADGRKVPYRPNGAMLPSRCPRGGFPFGATLTFLGGGQVSAETSVKCPRRR